MSRSIIPQRFQKISSTIPEMLLLIHSTEFHAAFNEYEPENRRCNRGTDTAGSETRYVVRPRQCADNHARAPDKHDREVEER